MYGPSKFKGKEKSVFFPGFLPEREQRPLFSLFCCSALIGYNVIASLGRPK
jgi:hypothetical protein